VANRGPGEPTIAIGRLARTALQSGDPSFAIALTVWYAGPCPGIQVRNAFFNLFVHPVGRRRCRYMTKQKYADV
jgi:hypothetical protein